MAVVSCKERHFDVWLDLELELNAEWRLRLILTLTLVHSGLWPRRKSVMIREQVISRSEQDEMVWCFVYHFDEAPSLLVRSVNGDMGQGKSEIL